MSPRQLNSQLNSVNFSVIGLTFLEMSYQLTKFAG